MGSPLTSKVEASFKLFSLSSSRKLLRFYFYNLIDLTLRTISHTSTCIGLRSKSKFYLIDSCIRTVRRSRRFESKFRA